MDEKILTHLKKDPIMAKVIQEITLPELTPHNDIYSELMDSIVSQQLSVKAAATIFGRFLDLFPQRKPYPELVLGIPVETLRGVGFSYQKAGYVHNVAEYWLSNNWNEEDWLAKSDAEIIEKLTAIKGVGTWTVQMILMFRLVRPDVFPVDDLGIQQGMARLYQLPETGKALKARMLNISAQWQPYRSYASRYVWKAKDLKLEI